jgi:protocatechuate 4,5-dioxygenase alpha chain
MVVSALHNIPGTFVFDGTRSRQGYHLNMFCMSLMTAKNRAAFKADEGKYLDQFPLTGEQRSAIVDRRWNDMLRLGGNVYYIIKLAATDGLPVAHMSAAMAGLTPEAYIEMMAAGGRKVGHPLNEEN